MTQSLTPNAKELIERFENATAQVGIIGLGYVGLPLAMLMVKAGYRTLGFDVDWEKVDRLNRGESYIHHFPAGRIQEAGQSGEHGIEQNLEPGEKPRIGLHVPVARQRP